MASWANIPIVFTVLSNSLFYPVFKINELNPTNLRNTVSIPIFLSNVAFANNPIILINSDKISDPPLFRIFFIWFISRPGIY